MIGQHCYPSSLSPPLIQRGFWLEYLTLGWNVIGTVIVLIAALRTGSAALAGFGLDSAIEISASVIVVWQLKGLEQGRESLALKLIGTAFIGLALYVLVQSAWTLLADVHPAPSPLGIVWLAVTCAIMLLLACSQAANSEIWCRPRRPG
jgi:divalent metal cation (Fe/Co/Zn/Cd) transporter